MSALEAASSYLQQVQMTFGTAPKSPFASIPWSVRRAYVVDRLGEPYRMTIELGTKRRVSKASELRGQNVWLGFARANKKQLLHGVVTEVQPKGSDGVVHILELTVEPALALLQHASSSRIFAQQSVMDIADAMLGAVADPYNRKKSQALGPRPIEKREYVVQHQETDLDFMLRVLAEEGIWVCFKQAEAEDEPEELVLTNANDLAPPIGANSELKLAPERDLLAHEEGIMGFSTRVITQPTKHSLRQFNWTHPEVFEVADADSEDPSGLSMRVAEYAGVQAVDYDSKQIKNHDTAAKVQLALESTWAPHAVASGESNVVLLRSGHTFTVDGTTYLITSVTHDGNAVVNTSGSSDNAAYINEFTCIAIDVPFRPRKRPAPRIAGVEYATVVDASGGTRAPYSASDGNDIAVDDKGHCRIRVKFHWDESAVGKDGTTSCWVRTMQPWAGRNWGFQFIPRVGMEVVVAFEAGDPDRPVVMGCVYNGLNPAPYAAKPTQSGIRTASSVNPTRFNEFRFEDAANNEEVYLKAQSLQTIQVGTDRNKTVGANQTEKVTKNKSIDVGGDHTETVIGNYDTTIHKDEKRHVIGSQAQTIDKDQTEVVSGKVDRRVEKSEKVAILMQASEFVGLKKAIKVGGMFSEQVGASRSCVAVGAWSATAGLSASLKASKHATVKATKKVTVEAGEEQTQKAKNWIVEIKEATSIKAGKKGVIELQDELLIKCGSASIKLEKNGNITLQGAKINIKGSGDVVIKGSKVTNN